MPLETSTVSHPDLPDNTQTWACLVAATPIVLRRGKKLAQSESAYSSFLGKVV